ncbi:MAG: hypothetical protein NTW79_00115, partial [Candidatus Berkelbacteria bacterium]|nr:hypothetical protein [Candidatus Berkelbacteria bacterium]
PKSQRKRQKPKRKTRNQQKNHLKSEVFNLEDHFFQKLINLEVWRQRHIDFTNPIRQEDDWDAERIQLFRTKAQWT